MPISPATLPSRLKSRAKRSFKAALPASFLPTPGLSEGQRPTLWAQPVQPPLPGVPNLYRVTPDLYRSAQPSSEGFAALDGFGIATILSMRQTVNDVPLAAGTGLALVRVSMKSRHVSEGRGDRVVRAMRALNSAMARGPVLVHCHHGSDRTGLIIALHRILTQGWTRQAALDELIAGGFGYHAIWSNIPRYIRKVDLRDLKARIDA
jgi:protein tyrosine/serine phosphatase